MMKTQKIVPHLWFDSRAEEAAEFYVSIFGGNSAMGPVAHYSEEGQEIHGRAPGSVMTIDFELAGLKFIALNGGPHFKFTPAISFFVITETEAETDELWQKLSEDGSVLMELDKYDWSEKYGWLQDKFGLTWQISLGKLEDVHGQKIVPSLMFVDEKGRAEEAVNLYTSLFNDSSITGTMRYGPGEDQTEGSVMHAQFRLSSNEVFMAMDSSPDQAGFTFNEAVSLMVRCKDQQEIDHFWENLSAHPEAEACGWLKDKFGVSWQIVPEAMDEIMQSGDKEKIKRAMRAMFQMKKLDVKALEDAFHGKETK